LYGSFEKDQRNIQVELTGIRKNVEKGRFSDIWKALSGSKVENERKNRGHGKNRQTYDPDFEIIAWSPKNRFFFRRGRFLWRHFSRFDSRDLDTHLSSQHANIVFRRILSVLFQSVRTELDDDGHVCIIVNLGSLRFF